MIALSPRTTSFFDPQQPQVPAQGGKGNMPLPADYQSRYGNYGFDSGLQNYLDLLIGAKRAYFS